MSTATASNGVRRIAWATFKITATYLVIGALWVLFTNSVLALLVEDPASLTRLQNFKGWIYLLATAWMLHVLIYRNMLAIRGSEEALEERKARLRAMVGAFDGHICVSSPECRVEYMNDNLIERTGRDAHGEPCHKVLHGLDELCPWCPRERVLQGEPVRTELRSPRDNRWYYAVYTPMHHPDGSVSCNCMLLDITERKEAEEATRISEERFKQVAENAQEWIWEIDANGLYTYSSPVVERILGYKPEEIVGKKHFYDLFHPEERNALWESASRAIRQKQPFTSFVNRNVHKNGHVVWLSTSGVPLLDEQGELCGYRGADTDITKRKQAEAERDRLAMAVEQAAEAIFVTDTRGIIQYVNPAFEKASGYTRVEALGRPYHFLKTGEEERRFFEEIERGLQRNGLWEGRVTKKRKNGTLYEANVTVSPMRDADAKVISYVAVSRDITHELELEKQFLQAQKMESVAQVAGGIAHDFNNYLTTILGTSRLMLDELEGQHPLREEIGEIVHAGESAARLTKQLLDLSRKKEASLRPLHLDEAVLKIDPLLRRAVGRQIEFETILGGGIGLIKADSGQLEQVLINLAVNARDAMPDGGRLTIETGHAILDEIYCRTRVGVTPGKYALLAVRDTGHGMSETVREHAFEPFFTTKKEGEGTGLGLTSVYGIVQQHCGCIEMSSKPSAGTEFRIYFPYVKTDGSR